MLIMATGRVQQIEVVREHDDVERLEIGCVNQTAAQRPWRPQCQNAVDEIAFLQQLRQLGRGIRPIAPIVEVVVYDVTAVQAL